MSRTTQLLISTLGTVLLAVTVSTTASAEPTVACPATAGTHAVICLQNLAGEKLALGLPTENQLTILSIKELEPSGTTTPSKFVIAGEEIECEEIASQGTLTGSTTGSLLISKLLFRFSECVVPKLEAECEVVSQPSGKGESGVITTLAIHAEQTGNQPGDIVLSQESTSLAEYRIKSKNAETCAEAMAPAILEGSILGTLLNSDTYQESHLLDFENSGGANFLLNKNEMRLTLTEVLFLDKPTNWGSTWNEHPPWTLFLRNEA